MSSIPSRNADPGPIPARAAAHRAAAPADGRPVPLRRKECLLARHLAAATLDVPLAEIAGWRRARAEVSRARHLAHYLAHVALQIPVGEIARSLGCDRSSVVYGVRRIEDERDDPAFDLMLTRLERVAALCAPLLQPRQPGRREARR